MAIVNEVPTAADDLTTTNKILAGDSFAGTIDVAGDEDWIAINMAAGETYTILMSGLTLDDAFMYLYDSTGALIAYDNNSGPGVDAFITYTPTVSQTYYIRADATFATGTGTYQIQTTGLAVPFSATPGDDVSVGTDADDQIDLLAGNDSYNAGTGNDTVFGNDGDDTIDGGSGDDLIEGGNGNDSLTGGQNRDTIDGGDGDDLIHAGAQDDRVTGGLGDDTIYSGSGDDAISGQGGQDSIQGGVGDDWLNGNGGRDTLEGGAGEDTVYGGGGNDHIEGNRHDDLLFGQKGDDHIQGDAGSDTIDGGQGNDVLVGGTGFDSIFGASGHDTLRGDAGQDTLSGGTGLDVMTGGADADTFVLKPAYGHDTITDFEDGLDKIDMTAFGPGIAVVASTSGANVELSVDGDTYATLENFSLANITFDDFIFA